VSPSPLEYQNSCEEVSPLPSIGLHVDRHDQRVVHRGVLNRAVWRDGGGGYITSPDPSTRPLAERPWPWVEEVERASGRRIARERTSSNRAGDASEDYLRHAAKGANDLLRQAEPLKRAEERLA